MESHPPTYTSATTTLLHDPLPLIAPHLPRPTLLSATLVSRRWNRIFTQHLWANPAAAFPPPPSHGEEATARDRAFDHRAFATCLPRARLCTRQLVRTLDLSRASPLRRGSSVASARTPSGSAPLPDRDLYATTSASARPAWLRSLTQRLPGLRCLLLRANEEVGHDVLVAFSAAGPNPLAGLKLLDVSDMPYATAKGLLALLQKCEGLVYLDVSGTAAARDAGVLVQLAHLRCLRVLVARELGRLSPERASALVKGLGRRVRWLDLRGTVLDGDAADALARECIGVAWEGASDGEEAEPPAYENVFGVRPGAGEERPGDFAGDVRRGLGRARAGRLSVEDEGEGGVTHLMLDGAGMGVREVCVVVGRRGLVYLDVDSGSDVAAMAVKAGQRVQPLSTRTVLRHLRMPYTVFFALFGHGQHAASPSSSSQTDRTPDLQRSLSSNLPALRTLTLTHVPSATHAPSATPTSASKSLAPASPETQDPAALIITLIRALAHLRQTAQARALAQAQAQARAAQAAASPAPAEASAAADAAPRYTPAANANAETSTPPQPQPQPQNPPHTPTTRKHPLTNPHTTRTARALHPLTTLTLEISRGPFPFPSPHAPDTKTTHPARRLTAPTSPSTAFPTRGWNHPSGTKSVTGDADSEALWVGAEGGGDFSFFDEEGDGDVVGREGEGEVVVDVVARVAAFRREARGRWEGGRGTGGGGERDEGEGGVVEGYWDGEVKVVRHF